MATLNLHNPEGLYSGGSVSVNALPYARLAMEARARIKSDGVISAVNRIDAAREELLLLDTWDQDRKVHIGSNLIEARNSLNSVIWHLSKERKKNEFGR